MRPRQSSIVYRSKLYIALSNQHCQAGGRRDDVRSETGGVAMVATVRRGTGIFRRPSERIYRVTKPNCAWRAVIGSAGFHLRKGRRQCRGKVSSKGRTVIH
jgi:hypothetical protein